MKQLIYVRVLNFPGGALQPVGAEPVHDHCYRVLDASEDPDHDVWEFEKGAVVRCESKEFSEGESGLVAVAKCSC